LSSLIVAVKEVHLRPSSFDERGFRHSLSGNEYSSKFSRQSASRPREIEYDDFDGQSMPDPQETNFDGREFHDQSASVTHEMSNHQSVYAFHQKEGCDVSKESGDQTGTRNFEGERRKLDYDSIKVRLFPSTFSNRRSLIKEHLIQRNDNVV